MKQKIKKIKNKLTSDHSEVLLEEMNSKIDLLLEGHAMSEEKIEGLDKKIDTKIDGLRGEMNSNFKTVFEYLSKIDDELQSIKSEIAELKVSLCEKADKNKLSALEERVGKLEENFLHHYNLAKATQ